MLSASSARYPQFVDRLEAATGVRPDYLQSSTLVVAAEPADREALHDLVEPQSSLGLSAEKLACRAKPGPWNQPWPAIFPGRCSALKTTRSIPVPSCASCSSTSTTTWSMSRPKN
ncbi:hypothetical protein AAHB37_12130 [Glutamicibacter halophytocola]|uniref:hypothetical protein n=1 Tax=Glutamicibacter halophytocola TaxID=1933880 RepID=UPI003219917E